MNRFSAWIAALAGLALVLSQPADVHAATKKKKKPAAEASDDDTTSSTATSTPAPKKSSAPPLDLPLPVKKDGGEKKEATPAPKKSKDGDGESIAKAPVKTEKPPEKPTEKTAEKAGTETKARSEHAPNATVEPETISEFAGQAPRIQQLIRDAIDLTRLNLTYTFGSSDPDNGGMDCSGTIYYLLRAHNFADVPRDSSGQYMWARRGGAFFPVVSKSADGPELKDLLPGDLMFWTGTYESGRDIPISHVMMYLGREKVSGKRIMFGASDGRSYNGIQRWGVSVFDFKMPNANPANPEKAKVEFIGYARIPGLRGPAPALLAAETETAEAPKKEATALSPTSTPAKKSSTKSTKKKKKADSE